MGGCNSSGARVRSRFSGLGRQRGREAETSYSSASGDPTVRRSGRAGHETCGSIASRHACIGSNRSSTSSSRRGSQEGKRVRHFSKSRGASPVHRALLPVRRRGGGGEGSGGAQKSAILSAEMVSEEVKCQKKKRWPGWVSSRTDQWVELVEMSLVSSVQAVNVRARVRRRSEGGG